MNFASESIAWRNGDVIPFTELALPVWDLGVVAGASLTEMARTYSHKSFRLAAHIERLLDSCAELGFEVAWSAAELEQAAEAVVSSNVQHLTANEDLGIVVFVTAGSNATYLGPGDLPPPAVGIHTFCLPFDLWRSSMRDGVPLIIPAQLRAPDQTLPLHIKTRNRLHWWLADRQVGAQAPGSRALLMDSEGRLTETSTSCFFAVIDGCITTPQTNVLNSMSCRLVTELAAQCQLAFERRDLTRDDIPQITEAFLSSTPVGLMPVRSIDSQGLPVNSADSVALRLLTAWEQLTGVNPRQQILTGA